MLNTIATKILYYSKLNKKVLLVIKEVILALSSTTDGETTNFFISRKLQPFDIKITAIARGISVGEELEYTDEITLGRSIINRVELK